MNVDKWIKKHIDINNLKNKNFLITGGNSGIGFELAKHLVKMSANVTLLCRSKEKVDQAIKELKALNSNSNVNYIHLDLADFSSIKKAAEEIKKIDVDGFINNAGVFRLPKGKTKDDFEIIMGTNYIGTLYLSSLILPYFASLSHKVHVIYETSITSKYHKINYNDFYLTKNYTPIKIYAYSKIAINNIFKYYVERYNQSNLIFSLTHPGGTYTPLITKGYRNRAFEKAAKAFMKLCFHSPCKASLTMLYALNKPQSVQVGPRGLFQISGFPKEVKFKADKKYQECVEFGLREIKLAKGEKE